MMWPFKRKAVVPPPDLTQYQGQWVAVRDNKVIAAASNVYPFLEMLTNGGLRGCTFQYVNPVSG